MISAQNRAVRGALVLGIPEDWISSYPVYNPKLG